ncbi:MAG TPA: O-antigen ligase family protein [Chitinophagaceae bacterium]|jgi:O-antigen ligase|nr:O-antigen ligase family protein [Chitinophagaceae bacterium]
MIVFLIIGAALFGITLIYKPGYIAVLLFTMIIADINIEMSALPLNVRAIISLALFARIIADSVIKNTPSFFSNRLSLLIFLYLVYTLLISVPYNLFTIELLKISLISLLSAFCGYYFYWKEGDYNLLKQSIILSGLICFADLVYTYKVYGGFPVRRIYSAYIGTLVESNWNFFGYICGIAFVFILNDFVYGKLKYKITILIMPVMLLGVLMSTSRSALLGVLVITIGLGWSTMRSREHISKFLNLILIGLFSFFIILSLFNGLKNNFNLSSSFSDKIMSRIIDEPVAVINKNLGYEYNASALGAMNWREEASGNAFHAFLNLTPLEQICGIGIGGFLYRNLGYGLNPHNGYLLILFETGLIGFLLYSILIVSLAVQTKQAANHSSILSSIFFVLVYCIGQNGEMTSTLIFLFIGTLMAQNKFDYYKTEILKIK